MTLRGLNAPVFRSDYGACEPAMARYRDAGTQRALALGNRGPLRFEADGALPREIRDAYSRCGFYVFTSVLGADELEDLGDGVEARQRGTAGDGRGFSVVMAVAGRLLGGWSGRLGCGLGAKLCQAVCALANDHVAGRQALAHLDHLVIHRAGLNVLLLVDVAVFDVDEHPWSVLQHRRFGHDDGVLCFAKNDGQLHVRAFSQEAVRVVRRDLKVSRALVGVDRRADEPDLAGQRPVRFGIEADTDISLRNLRQPRQQ